MQAWSLVNGHGPQLTRKTAGFWKGLKKEQQKRFLVLEPGLRSRPNFSRLRLHLTKSTPTPDRLRSDLLALKKHLFCKASGPFRFTEPG